ncbi:hypothetical protein [Desulfovibrio sp. Fe33]|nr:hypothetical protein [Desulfovibrio sp. Fe33]
MKALPAGLFFCRPRLALDIDLAYSFAAAQIIEKERGGLRIWPSFLEEK